MFKYVYGIVPKYNHKIEKTECIRVHAPAILHLEKSFPALIQHEALRYTQLVWTVCEQSSLLYYMYAVWV